MSVGTEESSARTAAVPLTASALCKTKAFMPHTINGAQKEAMRVMSAEFCALVTKILRLGLLPQDEADVLRWLRVAYAAVDQGLLQLGETQVLPGYCVTEDAPAQQEEGQA